MIALTEPSRLADRLDRLAGELERLRFGRPLSSEAAECERLTRTIRLYLVPRANDPATPLMTVFAGPTGSGKSTLINSLTGRDVSAAGPIRPTTKSPLVLTSTGLAGDLGNVAGVSCEVVDGNAPILDSMTFVDTPDIDSTSTEHRAMAEALIDNADVVVFVTSALRYADIVPWQVLRRAQSRGTDVICILNRVSSATRGSLVDFRSRLSEAGMSDEVITIAEHHLAVRSQRLPSSAVRALRRKLTELVDARSGTAERAFESVMGTTLRQTRDLEKGLRSVTADLKDLRSETTAALRRRAEQIHITASAEDSVIKLPESRRDLRGWRPFTRRGNPTRYVERLVQDVEAAVHQDIRRWLSEESDSGRWPVSIEPRQILAVILPVTRLVMEGWVASVDALPGDDAEEMVELATGELVGRLEVVYEQVGAHVSEFIETTVGVPDLNGVRSALWALKSEFALVDA